jgi:hypothetical protein
MWSRLLLVAGLAIDGLIIFLFAVNLQWLWAIFFVSLGILVALATTLQKAKLAGVFCMLGVLVIPVVVVYRSLPIHSFDWSPIERLDRLTIVIPSGDARIEITDRETLIEFLMFGQRGYYKTSVKCGGIYSVILEDGANRRRLAICYDSFSDMPGDIVRTVFVPRSNVDFRKWLERLLESKYK